MTKVFAADEIRLNLVHILSGSADPSVGPGVARPIGSFYSRTAGSPGLYQKTGVADVDWEKLSQSLAWLSVLDYGADPTGVADSTASFQAAIADADAQGGGRVFVPRGTYAISQINLTGTTGVQLEGAGPASVLRWTFNAATAAGSLLTITGGAVASRVANLRFDGAGLTNPAVSRENHLIRVDGTGGGVLDTRIEECWFGGMVANSGAGVRVVGIAANLVGRVWIRDNVFDGCSFYGVWGGEGWHIGWITDNYLTNNGTDIAVIQAANLLTDAINITNNEVIHTGAERRAVRFEGNATALLRHSIIANNVILGGFVTVSNARYCNVYGNPIFSGAFASTDPVLAISGAVNDCLFIGNVVDRELGSSAGACIGVTGTCSRFRIGDNVLLQEVTGSSFITATDCAQWSCGNNICRATNAGASTIHAIDLTAAAVAIDDTLIGPGNLISAAAGTFLSAVRVRANGANVLAVSLVSNQGAQIAYGAQFEDAGGGDFASNQIMFAGNSWNATTGDYLEVGVTLFPRIGFNAGVFGAQLLTGVGSPLGAVTARAGSMYLNRSGGQDVTAWYKESGTGTASWFPIAGSVLVFGTLDAGTAATALFMAPGYAATAGAAEVQMTMTRPGTVRNLRVQVAGAGTDAQNVTYTLRVNGVDSALAATIGNTATGQATDLVDSVAVVAGDLVSISIVKAGVVTAGQSNVIVTAELS